MSQVVSWHLRLTVKDGQIDRLRELVDDLIESSRQEPGTLIYEFYLKEDGSECQTYERYRDSDAVIAHLETFGASFAERFVDCVEVAEWFAYGEPSDEARGVLKVLGARILPPFGGFAR